MEKLKTNPYVPAEFELIRLEGIDILTTSGGTADGGSDDGYISDGNIDTDW